MEIEYQVKKIVLKTKTATIENDNFIVVKHWENGRQMLTAFIGQGETNNKKISIKLSPHGGILQINKLAGDALYNANILLKSDGYNSIASTTEFISLYKKEKERLLIDVDKLTNAQLQG